MTTTTKKLAKAGVAIWLDDLSRTRIVSGELSRMVAAGEIVGITTNPTIFAKSISAAAGYESQLQELALRGTAVGETLRLLTAWDVRAACDALHSVYENDGGQNGRVSIEVDPRISADSERTAAEARGLWWLVDRPNLFIKIPATQAALPAITASIADGISINVTLIFSIERYRAVLDAFMTGLEQRAARGRSLAQIASVASFFISRVDVEVNKRLSLLPDTIPEDVKRGLYGQAAIANARLAYEVYEEVAGSRRWQALAAKGASLQRLLWASTGVKDTTFAPTRYVTELVARDTVNTMPEATLQAVAELDQEVPDTISNGYAAAHRTIDDLKNLGIDILGVAEVLERQGLHSFVESWEGLIKSVEEQLAKAGAKVMPTGAVKPAERDGMAPAPAAAAPSETAK